MEARARGLFVFLTLLSVATAAVLIAEHAPRRGATTAAFQKQVGGLGFGMALDPPAENPIPGGDCFAPPARGRP